ncbi:hypothetical protein BH20VER2_BH20VER2_04410 [soil metagenome]
MDFRVDITDPTIGDLAEIVSYIARENPDAAATLGNILLDAALSLQSVPHKGSRYAKLLGVRKLSFRPFKIFYRVHEDTKVVEICASGTRHGANRSSDPYDENKSHEAPLQSTEAELLRVVQAAQARVGR